MATLVPRTIAAKSTESTVEGLPCLDNPFSYTPSLEERERLGDTSKQGLWDLVANLDEHVTGLRNDYLAQIRGQLWRVFLHQTDAKMAKLHDQEWFAARDVNPFDRWNKEFVMDFAEACAVRFAHTNCVRDRRVFEYDIRLNPAVGGALYMDKMNGIDTRATVDRCNRRGIFASMASTPYVHTEQMIAEVIAMRRAATRPEGLTEDDEPDYSCMQLQQGAMAIGHTYIAYDQVRRYTELYWSYLDPYIRKYMASISMISKKRQHFWMDNVFEIIARAALDHVLLPHIPVAHGLLCDFDNAAIITSLSDDLGYGVEDLEAVQQSMHRVRGLCKPRYERYPWYRSYDTVYKYMLYGTGAGDSLSNEMQLLMSFMDSRQLLEDVKRSDRGPFWSWQAVPPPCRFRPKEVVTGEDWLDEDATRAGVDYVIDRRHGYDRERALVGEAQAGEFQVLESQLRQAGVLIPEPINVADEIQTNYDYLDEMWWMFDDGPLAGQVIITDDYAAWETNVVPPSWLPVLTGTAQVVDDMASGSETESDIPSLSDCVAQGDDAVSTEVFAASVDHVMSIERELQRMGFFDGDAQGWFGFSVPVTTAAPAMESAIREFSRTVASGISITHSLDILAPLRTFVTQSCERMREVFAMDSGDILMALDAVTMTAILRFFAWLYVVQKIWKSLLGTRDRVQLVTLLTFMLSDSMPAAVMASVGALVAALADFLLEKGKGRPVESIECEAQGDEDAMAPASASIWTAFGDVMASLIGTSEAKQHAKSDWFHRFAMRTRDMYFIGQFHNMIRGYIDNLTEYIRTRHGVAQGLPADLAKMSTAEWSNALVTMNGRITTSLFALDHLKHGEEGPVLQEAERVVRDATDTQKLVLCTVPRNSCGSAYLGVPLTKLQLKLSEARHKLAGSVARAAPFVLQLIGPVAVGKTGLQLWLPAMLLKLIGLPVDAENMVYAKNMLDEYWEGYNGQPVCLIDDYANTAEPAGSKGFTAESAQVVSNLPYPLNMAFGDKHSVFFKSKLIILSSNRLLPQAKDMELYIPAFQRRRVPVLVRVKPEFLSGEPLGNNLDQYMKDSVNPHVFRKIRTPGGEPTMDIYEFSWLDQGATQVPSFDAVAWENFDTFFGKLGKMFVEHEKSGSAFAGTQSEVQNVLNGEQATTRIGRDITRAMSQFEGEAQADGGARQFVRTVMPTLGEHACNCSQLSNRLAKDCPQCLESFEQRRAVLMMRNTFGMLAFGKPLPHEHLLDMDAETWGELEDLYCVDPGADDKSDLGVTVPDTVERWLEIEKTTALGSKKHCMLVTRVLRQDVDPGLQHATVSFASRMSGVWQRAMYPLLALLAAGFAFGGASRIWSWFMGEKDESTGEAQVGSGPSPRIRVQAQKLTRAKVVRQGGSVAQCAETHEQVINAVAKNCVKIVRMVDGKQWRINAVGVTKDWVAIPYHMMRTASDGETIVMCRIDQKDTFVWRWERALICEDEDYVLYPTGTNRHFKHLEGHVNPMQDVTSVDAGEMSLVYLGGELDNLRVCQHVLQVNKVFASDNPNDLTNLTYRWKDWKSEVIPFALAYKKQEPGLCGALLVSHQAQATMRQRIVGWHIMGRPQVNQGYAIPFPSPSQWRDLDASPTMVADHSGPVAVKKDGSKPTTVTVTVGEGQAGEDVPDDGGQSVYGERLEYIPIYGKLERTYGTVYQSKYVSTKHKGEVYPVAKEATQLGRVELPERTYHVMGRQLKSMDDAAGRKRFVDQALMDQVVEHSAHVWLSHCPEFKAKFADLHDNINGGVDGGVVLRGIDVTKAAGYPRTGAKSEFLDVYELPDGKKEYTPGTELAASYAAHRELFYDGVPVTNVATMTAKSEKRDIKRTMLDPKTRAFMGTGFDHYLLLREVFGWSVASLVYSYAELASKVGIDPGADWNYLAHYLSGKGLYDLLRMLAYDVKGFDINSPAEAIRSSYAVLMRMGEIAGASAEWVTAAQRLVAIAASNQIIAGQTLLAFESVWISGTFGTAVFGSMQHYNMILYCLARIFGPKHIPEIAKALFAALYADDNIMNWGALEQLAARLGVELTLERFVEEMALIGFTLTDTDKIHPPKVRPLSECEFLSRRFVKNGPTGDWMCPLEWDSVTAVFNHRSRGVSEEAHWRASVLHFERELGYYGEEVYNTHTQYLATRARMLLATHPYMMYVPTPWTTRLEQLIAERHGPAELVQKQVSFEGVAQADDRGGIVTLDNTRGETDMAVSDATPLPTPVRQLVGDTNPQAAESVFDRWYQLGSYTWNTASTGKVAEYSVPGDLIASSPALSTKLDYFEYLSYDAIDFYVTVNGSMYTMGGMQIVWAPLSQLDPATWNENTVSLGNFEGQISRPADNVTTAPEIPYVSVQPALRLVNPKAGDAVGSIIWHVLVVLDVTNGATADIEMTLFFRFRGVRLMGPTISPATLVARAPTIKDRVVRRLRKELSRAQEALRKLEVESYEGEAQGDAGAEQTMVQESGPGVLARTVDTITSTVGGVVDAAVGLTSLATTLGGLFGLCKPTGEQTSSRVQPYYYSTYTNVTGESAAQVLGLDSKNAITPSPITVGGGDGVEATSITRYISKYGLVSFVGHASDSISGTRLLVFPVTPSHCFIDTVTTKIRVWHIALSWVSRFWQNWAGTIRYYFEFVLPRGGVVTGRMMVAFVPGTDAAVTAASVGEVYNVILDMSDKNWVGVDVPFIYNRAFAEVGVEGLNTYQERTCTGTMQVVVINKLAGASVPTTYKILVAQSGGPDFIYNGLSMDEANYYTYPAVPEERIRKRALASAVGEAQGDQGMDVTPMPDWSDRSTRDLRGVIPGKPVDRGVLKAIAGEYVPTLKSLAQRPTCCGVVDQGPSTGSTSVTGSQYVVSQLYIPVSPIDTKGDCKSLLSSVAAGFRMYHGGIEYWIDAPAKTDLSDSATDHVDNLLVACVHFATDPTTYTYWTWSARQNFTGPALARLLADMDASGSVTTNMRVNPTLHVKVPYYGSTLADNVPNQYSEGSLNQYPVANKPFLRLAFISRLVPQPTAGGVAAPLAPNLIVRHAASDDFNFGFQVSPPIMTTDLTVWTAFKDAFDLEFYPVDRP